jgi:hypothetical protein
MDTPMNEMCEKCHYRITAQKNKAPDMGQMLKLAMMVSKMFAQTGGAKPQTVTDSTHRPERKHSHPGPAVFSMDSLAEDKKIKIIKASLPYLDPTYQQLMHIVAKCLELKNIMNPELYSDKVASKSDNRRSSLGMLTAIKPHLEPGEQAAMNIACKAIEMIEIFRLMDTITSGPNPGGEKDSGVSDIIPPAFESIEKNSRLPDN